MWEEAGGVSEPGGIQYAFEPISDQVIGAAIAVHKALGPGFREDLYEAALLLELDKRGIPYEPQKKITVYYLGKPVGTHVLDLVVGGCLVVELKATSALGEVHTAQLLGYLRASRLRVGLILNFGEMPLGIRRVINSFDR